MNEKNPGDLEFGNEDGKNAGIPGDDLDLRTPGSDIEMSDEFISKVLDKNEKQIIAELESEKTTYAKGDKKEATKKEEKLQREAEEKTLVEKQRIIKPPKDKRAA